MKEMDAYDVADIERWVAEPTKRAGRTPFARDRARVLHSAGLRRLAAKTQVVGPGTSDFHRTRLTHTLEVAQVGRELGGVLGCDPDVVDAACLAHDLGHPPFGHNGEAVLDEVAAGIGGFEGNAQTLRLLTRLEAKTPGAGLNLTRATLDAATKYPWVRGPDTRKFGVYEDDLEVFGWLRNGFSDGVRCFEAQVMDFADDVAYSVHDVEDGVVAGLIDFAAIETSEVWQTVRDWYLPDATDDALSEAYESLRSAELWPNRSYDGSRPALAELKGMTSRLIGRFCGDAVTATRARHGLGRLTRYRADLEVPDRTRREIAVLKGLAGCYVMRTDEREVVQKEQRQVIRDLVERLTRTAPDGLDPEFRADFEAAPNDAARLRVVIDQVASLTDASAYTRHEGLGS